MIIERLPDVQSLSDEEKWMLVDELQASLLADGERQSVKQAITTNLEKQLAHYEAHPETAKTWEQVRDGLRSTK